VTQKIKNTHDEKKNTQNRSLKIKSKKGFGDRKITLGPAGPPLHKGVFVVLQSVQLFLFSITSTDNDS
jgi:hypothetical protein